jgi:hypothetical protein
MSNEFSWSHYLTSLAFSWPALLWPTFLSAAEYQGGWRQAWNEAWTGLSFTSVRVVIV